MASPRVQNIKTGVKVIGIAVITVLLFILVVNAMRNPVDVDTRSYSADFTDASGLHPNGDVRFRGKRVGKVTSVELKQGADKSTPLAHVEFTLDTDHVITDTTSLAIKYQNLTGVRYVDVRPGEGNGRRVSHVPTERTVPSFDITRLFNGLQPVLVTMNAKDINQFSENAIALLQGDGGGLGPMLDSTQKLTKYAKNRQQLISTLTGNLARITESMGGRNENVIGFLQAVDEPMSAAMTVLDEFAVTASAGPALFEPLERILAALEIKEDTDMEVRIKSVFKDATSALGVFELMPNTLAGIKSAADFQPGIPPCSKGNVYIPLEATFFIKGSEVVLCNP
ncbi:MCE family protein [Gordonia pseudamarae]|jgi:phospholipid/cholesterol/gamma-HCH transport system substrate-binding protein|uniref:MCE family protein n=1 Tax=Gordonia pseudamarae TaxID=2831662 RepID=A0ABX6INP2_9ACTN|nr:MlaD family protein [Gordonia pseudamarae]MBD0024561.1 MCE family protein [Gordonia sp. (in: high G+C Gram-positive bacteria)]QHN27906.1 MCE family protein [Gordonia pseudamarae]QHN36763.1 MCE family protein [Gordonia pseudamarae]